MMDLVGYKVSRLVVGVIGMEIACVVLRSPLFCRQGIQSCGTFMAKRVLEGVDGWMVFGALRIFEFYVKYDHAKPPSYTKKKTIRHRT